MLNTAIQSQDTEQNKLSFFFLFAPPMGLQGPFPIHFIGYCELTNRHIKLAPPFRDANKQCQSFIRLKTSIGLKFSMPVFSCRPLCFLKLQSK